MVRPAAYELTGRELEVMHLFWKHGEMTAIEARDHFAQSGTDLTYVTIANLVRVLQEKGFLESMNDERPFRYRPARSYEDVSDRLLTDLIRRVFRGSREQLLLRLVKEQKLSAKERAMLKDILKEAE